MDWTGWLALVVLIAAYAVGQWLFMRRRGTTRPRPPADDGSAVANSVDVEREKAMRQARGSILP
ncbi:hypothetical protein [Agromyces sp. NPDC058064]|uniref:hypothetical protein n=1 Tax=Agromyces sp. NPDC058064 TaxID=3346322 RepID=UPI0036DBD5D9